MFPLAGRFLLMPLVLLIGVSHSVEALPLKGIQLSFPPFTSTINCSIDGSADTLLKPSDICTIGAQAKQVILSADNVISARYQYKKRVQLWLPRSGYAASFSTMFVVAFLRSGDRVEVGNFNSFGGGIAFAITPDQKVGSSGPESFGLFEIDDKTGMSLRGGNTKTLAVEIDISRRSTVQTFNDPQIPHVGIDINSVKSSAANSLGTFRQVVDRKLAVFIDYDAQKQLLQVRLQILGFAANTTVMPNKKTARLYLNYRNLRLSSIVNPESYVGFSSRLPEQENGAYVLYDWKFSTTWVPVSY
ncbi:hypothetical protein KP509_09G058400 [Ceratopteris richardii]|uniref:Legume lectin domain-containing protein n=1 Tax=Ceratopteris richardii TaxID=49495 RepID=A0A8T2U4I4_CERRI|nr:hypothetical protein KP509_09G058400 [Ceratopteris richardii]